MADIGDTVKLPKHLKSGDPEAKLDENRYTLFGFRFCPFTERVRLVLSHHKIDHDLIQIALHDKPDWFVRLIPGGKVPALIHHGEKLLGSDFIMRFVDELRGPEASLLNHCGMVGFQQALDAIGKLSKPFHQIMFDQTIDAETEKTFHEAIEHISPMLKKDYFAGDQVSLADYAVFPFLDRLEIVVNQLNKTSQLEPKKVSEQQPVTMDKYPELTSYIERMRRLPSVAAVRQPTRMSSLFAETYRAGNPNPEI